MWENWIRAEIMLLEELFDGKYLLFFEQLVSKSILEKNSEVY